MLGQYYTSINCTQHRLSNTHYLASYLKGCVLPFEDPSFLKYTCLSTLNNDNIKEQNSIDNNNRSAVHDIDLHLQKRTIL